MSNPVAMMEAGFSKSLRTACSSLAGFATNKVRIEPQGQSSGARAGTKISFSLPSNSLVNLRTATLVCPKVTTTSDVSCVAILPRISDLIESCSIFLNGVSLTMNSSQYNTIASVVDKVDSSVSQGCTTGTIENQYPPLPSGFMATPSPFVDGKGIAMALCLNNVKGIFSNSSVRYLDLSTAGDLRVEFLLAPDWNLWFINNRTDAGIPFSNLVSPADPATKTYTLQDFHMTCEVVSIAGGLYSELMRAKIMEQEFIQVNYKDYVSLESNTAPKSTSTTTRFGCSTQSLDAVYCTMRASDYATPPVVGEVPAYAVASVDGNFHEMVIPKSKYFQAFSGNQPASTNGTPGQGGAVWVSDQNPIGDLRHSIRINGVQYPQVPSNLLECHLNTNLHQLRQKHNTPGNAIISQKAFYNGQFVCVTKLNQDPDYCDDDMACARISGINSRNINTDLTCQFTGLDNVNDKSVFVVAEMTSSVRIGSSKSVVRIP